MVNHEISLSKVVPGDFKLLARWLNNKEINMWLANYWRDSISPRKVAISIRNSSNLWYLVKYENHNCGVVALSDIEKDDRTAMIWYFLGDNFLSNKGIISTAIHKLLRISFEELNLSCVYAWYVEDNKASSKVLEKNGFTEIGSMPSSFNFNGNLRSRKYVYLTSELWKDSGNRV